ncbi:thioredoxin domain-containing protein [Paraburkholderia agricolaris]|uniref:Thioredoxin domain-containing protein n=1 Tax=Paraburkholderia agricolaris TaxID=2152888 RepID=A0ABW8ZM00_9BURK
MNPTKPPHHKAHRLLWPISLMVVLCLIALVWSLQLAPWRTHDGEPPWIYGAPDARFTIIEYADLECPYCRAYYPQLRIWIDAHHDVNWQWHHFPLTAHEPAARIEAKLVECTGRADGQRAFWTATAWVYAHTRGNGDGLPASLSYPGLDRAATRCLREASADTAIQADVDAAQREQILGTPSLKLVDHTTGRTLLIPGPARSDALLSAIDQLTAREPLEVRPPPASSAITNTIAPTTSAPR